MKTIQKKVKYVEWLSAEIMHESSVNCLSELNFIKEEQNFFDDLVKSYTLQLVDSKHFDESKEIVDKLNDFQNKTTTTIESIKDHEKNLRIMVDGVDQLKEEEMYKNEHRALIIAVSEFLSSYRAFKMKLFDLIKRIMKEGKQKRLLN